MDPLTIVSADKKIKIKLAITRILIGVLNSIKPGNYYTYSNRAQKLFRNNFLSKRNDKLSYKFNGRYKAHDLTLRYCLDFFSTAITTDKFPLSTYYLTLVFAVYRPAIRINFAQAGYHFFAYR